MATPISSPPRSPPPSRSGATAPLPEHPKEGLISRLLITPLTFLSFILSLFLVSSHDYSVRTSLHTHDSPRPPPTTLYGKLKASLHAIVFTRTTSSPNSPYAYISNPMEKEKIGIVGAEGYDIKSVSTNEHAKEKEGEWYYHSNQKKMMRAELADAFRIRKWVLAVLVVGGGCLAAIMAVGVCLFIGLGFRVWLREGAEEGF